MSNYSIEQVKEILASIENPEVDFYHVERGMLYKLGARKNAMVLDVVNNEWRTSTYFNHELQQLDKFIPLADLRRIARAKC